MFKYPHIHVGPLKPGEKTKIVFPYENIHVTTMTASCGCSVPTNDPVNKNVTVEYEAALIPPHLKQEGKKELTTSKTIKITYVPVDNPLTADGKQNEFNQLLVFTALIVEP